MRIYTVLESDGNVRLYKSSDGVIGFLTKNGSREIYVSGSRKLIKLREIDIKWEIDNHVSVYFHTTATIENYYFRVQTHEL
jgi:hypothetical protein